MMIDLLLGQFAMARGRVREALARYHNAQRIAKARRECVRPGVTALTVYGVRHHLRKLFAKRTHRH